MSDNDYAKRGGALGTLDTFESWIIMLYDLLMILLRGVYV